MTRQGQRGVWPTDSIQWKKKKKKKAEEKIELDSISQSPPLPSSHSASTRAALTSVTGAPDFSRRALISWSWFEGALAAAAEEAKDRRCRRRRRSACSSASASRDADDVDDDDELEMERRQSKRMLLPSLHAAEKEQELEACF